MPSGECQNKASQWKQWCYQQTAADPNKSMSVWLIRWDLMVSLVANSLYSYLQQTHGHVIAFWPWDWINECFSNNNETVWEKGVKDH